MRATSRVRGLWDMLAAASGRIALDASQRLAVEEVERERGHGKGVTSDCLDGTGDERKMHLIHGGTGTRVILPTRGYLITRLRRRAGRQPSRSWPYGCSSGRCARGASARAGCGEGGPNPSCHSRHADQVQEGCNRGDRQVPAEGDSWKET